MIANRTSVHLLPQINQTTPVADHPSTYGSQATVTGLIL